MTKLAYLHEPGVLYNLRCRYDINEIYVSIKQLVCIQTFPFRACCLVKYILIVPVISDASCHCYYFMQLYSFSFDSGVWTVLIVLVYMFNVVVIRFLLLFSFLP